MIALPHDEVVLVSSGTLRPQDLLMALAQELEDCTQPEPTPHQQGLVMDGMNLSEFFDAQVIVTDDDYETMSYTLTDLYDELNNIAPDTHYFGANPHTPDEIGWFPHTYMDM